MHFRLESRFVHALFAVHDVTNSALVKHREI